MLRFSPCLKAEKIYKINQYTAEFLRDEDKGTKGFAF
jgi:hypothetical protein